MGDQFEEKLEFEWDRGNLDKNWQKHKVTNKEAEEIFFDNKGICQFDTKHSKIETRWLLLGRTKTGRKLAAIFTKRKSKIRVISVRPMDRKEKTAYKRSLK